MAQEEGGFATLREHLELTNDVIRLQEQVKASAYQLNLDKTELSRRLDELNHSHRDAQQKEVTFLSVARFEEFIKANTAWRETVMVSMAANSGKWGAFAGVFASALAIAAILMRFVGK